MSRFAGEWFVKVNRWVADGVTVEVVVKPASEIGKGLPLGSSRQTYRVEVTPSSASEQRTVVTDIQYLLGRRTGLTLDQLGIGKALAPGMVEVSSLKEATVLLNAQETGSNSVVTLKSLTEAVTTAKDVGLMRQWMASGLEAATDKLLDKVAPKELGRKAIGYIGEKIQPGWNRILNRDGGWNPNNENPDDRLIDSVKRLADNERGAIKVARDQNVDLSAQTQNHIASPSGRIDYSRDFHDATANFKPGYQLSEGPLQRDLILVQFHGDSELGTGRSAKYWTSPAEANSFRSLEDVTNRLALIPEWGARNSVSVAIIPKGTDVSYFVGQAEAKFSNMTSSMFEGEGTQYRFKDFDPSWIVETRKLPK